MSLNNKFIMNFRHITRLHTESFNIDGGKIHSLSGSVQVEITRGNEIIFNENLRWENENSLLLNSRNVYRWAFPDSGNIRLDHLRFGKDKPVFLVEFSKSGENSWKSIEPHDCNNDLYSAELNFGNNNIILHWTVNGPTENYTLKTVYT